MRDEGSGPPRREPSNSTLEAALDRSVSEVCLAMIPGLANTSLLEVLLATGRLGPSVDNRLSSDRQLALLGTGTSIALANASAS